MVKAPQNGIQLRRRKSVVLVVYEIGMNRDMTSIIYGNDNATCVFPRTVVVVRKKAYANRKTLQSVQLNGALQTLEDHCFEMSGIRKLVLPSGITTIESSAFRCCQDLLSADLRAARGLKKLRYQAFSECKKLGTVLLEDGLEIIGDYCFYQSGLKELVVPSSVLCIQKSAFRDCERLKQVSFTGNMLKIIEENAFADSGLESFVAPQSLCKIGGFAFTECKNLKHTDLSACTFQTDARKTYQKDSWFKNVFDNSRLETVILPCTLRIIGESMFANCRHLKSIEFGANSVLEEIKQSSFYESGLESFTAPASLKRVGSQAFYNCKSLKHADFSACTLQSDCRNDLFSGPVFSGSALENVVLPRALRVIGKHTFEGCKYLKSVCLGDDPMLEVIGIGAFQESGLESFTAPPLLRKISDLAFRGCSQLKNVKLNGEIQELGWLCFWGTQIKDLKIPPQVGKTPEQLGIGQTNQKVLRLPGGLETVGSWWFLRGDMEKVIVPSCVRTFEKGSFYQCEQLQEVVFEPGSCLERIEQDCFGGCGLTKVIIPRSVRYIGRDAFNWCEQLREVSFEPDSRLESIEYSCFTSSGLEKIVIPKSVRSIGDYAFDDCQKLSSLTFEEDSLISSVGVGAFERTQLTPENVEYPDTLKTNGREFGE